MYAAVYRSN